MQSVIATMVSVLAQGASTTAPAATNPAATTPKPWWVDLVSSPFPMLMALLLLVMVFNLRGKKNEQKQREEMLNAMKRGDRIQTIGGVLGTVVDVRDNEVVVKVDESSNTKMTFIRTAIHRVLTEKKSEAK